MLTHFLWTEIHCLQDSFRERFWALEARKREPVLIYFWTRSVFIFASYSNFRPSMSAHYLLKKDFFRILVRKHPTSFGGYMRLHTALECSVQYAAYCTFVLESRSDKAGYQTRARILCVWTNRFKVSFTSFGSKNSRQPRCFRYSVINSRVAYELSFAKELNRIEKTNCAARKREESENVLFLPELFHFDRLALYSENSFVRAIKHRY